VLCAAAHNTYIPTREGWVFLATAIDCYTKAVIGWAMSDNYQTPLVSAAVGMAVRNHDIKEGAIFHSDRGSNNYTSAEFGRVLRQGPGKVAAGVRVDVVGVDAPGAWVARRA
jgi:transposase InsO family protein